MDWIKVKDRLPAVAHSKEEGFDKQSQESEKVIGFLSSGDVELVQYFTYQNNDGTIGTGWFIPSVSEVVENFDGLRVVAWMLLPPTEGLL